MSDLIKPVTQPPATRCANCQAELTGPYCATCGQPQRSRRGTVAYMISEASEDILRFDSKFYKSLLHLMTKPGFLSRQFIEGKRVSILPPIRMYLVISLLFFFVFDIPSPDVKDTNVYIGDILIGKEEKTEGQPTFKLISFDREDDKAFTEWFDQFFSEKMAILKTTDAQVVMDRIFNKLEDIVPNVLILFMPIFALLLKLLYLFKRVLYFDHLIFSLHFQSWLMISILIIYGLAQYNPWWSALSIVLPFYLAQAQKRVYQQTYWLVIPKTFVIIVLYLFLLALATLASFMAALALF
ncbi:DUF3667 domain-containing protein [Aliikangiella marina]|uniref:DUF3667 domain-containing protein n=1 Tax=Aliikangiella marina TaxID=1712262 RepID=UPI00163D6E33|nr:DUF3667 domain-containing protein [Aliikangiella marina]